MANQGTPQNLKKYDSLIIPESPKKELNIEIYETIKENKLDNIEYLIEYYKFLNKMDKLNIKYIMNESNIKLINEYFNLNIDDKKAVYIDAEICEDLQEGINNLKEIEVLILDKLNIDKTKNKRFQGLPITLKNIYITVVRDWFESFSYVNKEYIQNIFNIPYGCEIIIKFY